MALGAQRTPPHRPPISRFFDEIYLSLRQGSGYLRLLEQLNTDVNAKRFLGTLAQAAEQIQLQIVNNARPALAEVVVNDFNARFSPPPRPRSPVVSVARVADVRFFPGPWSAKLFDLQ